MHDHLTKNQIKEAVVDLCIVQTFLLATLLDNKIARNENHWGLNYYIYKKGIVVDSLNE